MLTLQVKPAGHARGRHRCVGRLLQCAAPTAQMEVSKAAVEHTSNADTAESPAELQSAKDKLTRARQADEYRPVLVTEITGMDVVL